MKLRSELMIRLRDRIADWNTTQTAAAKRLGITQPRLNDLLRGRVDKFSLDALVGLVGKAGLVVRLQIKPAAQPYSFRSSGAAFWPRARQVPARPMTAAMTAPATAVARTTDGSSAKGCSISQLTKP